MTHSKTALMYSIYSAYLGTLAIEICALTTQGQRGGMKEPGRCL